jgi:hypothetical protein
MAVPMGQHQGRLVLQSSIHRLWDELADFDARQTQAASRHLQETLCRLAGVWNARWAAGVRVKEQFGDDPLQGWRLIEPQVLYRLTSAPVDARFKEMVRQCSAAFVAAYWLRCAAPAATRPSIRTTRPPSAIPGTTASASSAAAATCRRPIVAPASASRLPSNPSRMIPAAWIRAQA